MQFRSDISNAQGLYEEERILLRELMDVYNFHYSKNRIKDKYYTYLRVSDD